MFEWDEAKRRSNLAKHGLDFRHAADFEFETALQRLDNSSDLDEIREIATGFLDDRLVVLVYVRRGDAVRVISLRRATRREANEYVEAIERGA